MDKKVIKFPNKNNEENTIGNEISMQNMNYFNSVKAKMENEYNALVRSGNEDIISLGAIVSNITNSIVNEIENVFTSNPELNTRMHAAQFLAQTMQSVNAIISGGIISPLTGCEEEWQDITVPEDIGQTFKIKYRGVEHEIPIQSIQVNVRYPRIYRLNGDNNFAHRTDYFQFIDVAHPGSVHLTEDSIRFIKFPYTMQTIHSNCIVDDNVITEYLDYEYDDVANGLIYPDSFSDDPYAYLIAPKIPFHMLDSITDVEGEISEYVNEIKAMEEFNGFEFDEE